MRRCRHDSERQPRRFEPGPLLDVKLEIRGEFLRVAARGGRIALLAERPQRLSDGDALPVPTVPNAPGQTTERCGRSKEPHTEARALLVGPGHDLDRAAQRHIRIA